MNPVAVHASVFLEPRLVHVTQTNHSWQLQRVRDKLLVQQTLGSYLWLGQYDRQVASTINYSLKGDGRLYGVYMKTDSYVEGLGVDEIWQAVVQTK